MVVINRVMREIIYNHWWWEKKNQSFPRGEGLFLNFVAANNKSGVMTVWTILNFQYTITSILLIPCSNPSPFSKFFVSSSFISSADLENFNVTFAHLFLGEEFSLLQIPLFSIPLLFKWSQFKSCQHLVLTSL